MNQCTWDQRKINLLHNERTLSWTLMSSPLALFRPTWATSVQRKSCAVFWGNSYYRRIVIDPANQKGFYLGLVEMTCRPVNASYSLPEWQAVKLTFSATWCYTVHMSKWNKTIHVWCIWRYMVALTLNADITNIFMRQNALIIKITYSKHRI